MIGIIDTTLRDAQQCLWTTRMTASMMWPIAEQMDAAGFDMIDFMAPVQFDVCVRYLKEDPWEKARLLKQRFRRTRLRGYCRSKSLVGFSRVGAELAAAHPGLRWRWVDVEDEAETLDDLDIETFPTLLVLAPEGLRFAGAIAPQEDTLRRLLRACVEDHGGEAASAPAQTWTTEAAAAARRLALRR